MYVQDECKMTKNLYRILNKFYCDMLTTLNKLSKSIDHNFS